MRRSRWLARDDGRKGAFVISIQAYLCFELVASAVLALWVVARFPRLGPSSLRPASALCLGSIALVRLVPIAATLLRDLPHGGYAVLFACAVAFFVAFLSAIWLMRSFAGMLGSPGTN